MLFDLRGRGRRRTVQVIYVGLALLMGGGLVFFGIGGGTNGGLLDAIKGGSNGSGGNVLKDDETKALKVVALTPSSPAAWAALTRARFALAGQQRDKNTGAYSKEGLTKLAQTETAWKKYLSLNPPKPDVDLATLMVQALGPNGLNNLTEAVQAQQIVVDAVDVKDPSAYTAFTQLALLAYAAGNTRTGDLAAQRAVELAPKDQRADLQKRFKEAKAAGAGATTGTGSGTSSGSSSGTGSG